MNEGLRQRIAARDDLQLWARQPGPQVCMLFRMLDTWYRVFGRNDFPVDSPALLEWLRAREPDATGRFRGDELGWFEALLELPSISPPLIVERFLTKEDDIRGELNTWAAWLESIGETAEHARLMQQVIATVQLFTLHQGLDDDAEESEESYHVQTLCLNLCQFLARSTDGIFQIDGRGFFAADGNLLVAEEEKNRT